MNDMTEEFGKLPGPIEFLELRDRESVTLKVVSWERGTTEIATSRRGREVTIEIPVLRVHVTTETKPYPPNYYDISSKTLTAQLLPLLLQRGYEKWSYRVTAHGVAPRKRFTLERLPY